MRRVAPLVLFALAFVMIAAGMYSAAATRTNSGSQPTYDVTTLAGKVASLHGTAGLQLRFSDFVEREANAVDPAANPTQSDPITPTFVLSSPLDGTSIAAPDVTVNQDRAAASQNEPVIAVDPNNPNRIVAGANDYVTRTWTCSIGSTPCSALGDGYSGTYFSNDGGKTWCCKATDPKHLGTLIPGVEHLTGGQYDAGGDPALAFDSHGNVFFAGLGFDRAAPPNTVTVSKGTFDDEDGTLSWGQPTFINPTTSPAILNDKEWIAVDAHHGSAFQDRVYVSWTRFIFNPVNGRYVQSPIFFAFSADGGATFSEPESIVENVLYDQGSRPVVGPDGAVYVFWEGMTRHATFDSIYVVKSTDGGEDWSKPLAISTVTDIVSPANTAFRVNSFPAAAVAKDGTLYAVWNTEANNTNPTYTGDAACATSVAQKFCHTSVVWSSSKDGGASWTDPKPAFPKLEKSTRKAEGYPVTSPWGVTLDAPAPRTVDTVFPAVAVAPSGHAIVGAYAADVVSPWLRCARTATPTAVGRINCLLRDNYTNNARLDYVVADLTSKSMKTVTTHPINTRYHFGGGFIGDYTDLAIGSDGVFHAIWMDTNNVQTVKWWYGFQFVPTPVHQQDVVTASGSF